MTMKKTALFALSALTLNASAAMAQFVPYANDTNGDPVKTVPMVCVNPITGASISCGGGSGGAVTQGTSPWVDNISQFGGSNVVTGTGASGPGVPRVTVSSDSFPNNQNTTDANSASNLAANQATNTDLGAPGTPVATADTGSFAINAILQRIAQNVTLVKTTLNSPFQAGGAVGQGAQAATGTASTAWWMQGIEMPGSAATGGGTRAMGSDGTNARDISTTTTGALQPPSAASGKLANVAYSATTTWSQMLAADANRILLRVQQPATGTPGIVYVDETGSATIGGACTGSATGSVTIPATVSSYYLSPIASRTAIYVCASVATTITYGNYDQ